MKALLYQKPGRANGGIVEVPDPVCGDGQVLIRVMACGICKPADTSHDRAGAVLGRYPVIPGHEFSGIVEKVGKCVTHFKPGDRVTADNGIPCRKCYHCQRGEFAFCEDYQAIGHSVNGAMAELVVVNESHVYAIPDTVSFKAAALTELVGCSFRCIERCSIPYSADVLILGCGASGNLLAQLAKGSAAGTVTVLDCQPSKLDRLASRGIGTILADPGTPAAHEAILRERFPHGLDVIIDAIGNADLTERSIPLLKAGGTFANYSFPTTEKRTVSLDMGLFVRKELNYIGTTWAGACDELLNNVLRDEWGFQGFVLTDYFGVYGYMDSDQAIRGGTDCMLVAYDTETNHVTDTTSATSVLAMRQACKNILYTTVNSRAYDPANLSGGGLQGWQIAAIAIDVVVGVILVAGAVMIVKKSKKMEDASAEDTTEQV